jgi:hypothetical protein
MRPLGSPGLVSFQGLMSWVVLKEYHGQSLLSGRGVNPYGPVPQLRPEKQFRFNMGRWIKFDGSGYDSGE